MNFMLYSIIRFIKCVVAFLVVKGFHSKLRTTVSTFIKACTSNAFAV